jgi:glycine/D-amino acid oxidase-like deaminating enzyme
MRYVFMVYILGAGIAGLSLAEALSRAGIQWCMLEKESKIGLYASGKNAGIIRTYETDPVIRHFAEQTLATYRAEEPGFNECGLIIKPWDIDYSLENAERRSFTHGRDAGYLLPNNGTVCAGAVLARLLASAQAEGEVRLGFDADIVLEAGCLVALKNKSGNETLPLGPADAVVIASGEGALQHAAALQRPLGLVAHRRNLYEYANVTGYAGPVEWNEETSCYFRADGDLLVATAGEQIPHGAGIAVEKAEVVPGHLSALAKEYPLLAQEHLTGWRTCLRVMPADNRPYCGADVQVKNLWWFAGLGGRGMSLAPALAAELAQQITGSRPASDAAAQLSPERAELF